MRRDDATEAQVRAANPGLSVWLAANAGSGKTRVLTDRVARLLLGGTQPQRILCLTYTKAAASEMQNRLFRRLGSWAMLEQGRLRAELAELGVEGAIGADVLARARRLFAQAIETPGGLKIQTIHSFCAGLLRRFPLEARVSPNFTELDERAAILMQREIVEELAAGADVAAVDALAGLSGADDLSEVLGEICRNSDAFADAPPDLAGGVTADGVLRQVFIGDESEVIAALVPMLLAGGMRDAEAGAKLAGFRPDLAGLALLEDVLLTKSGSNPYTAKIGAFPGKELRTGRAAQIMPAVEALMRRVEAAREARLAVMATEKTRALYRFARAFLPRYRARKTAFGLLDFDDLIARAAALLSDRDVAAWVLYRLDGGIDHILVDEAQDTSPGQWQVIKALSEEFTAGEGASAGARRIFVVGDKKQSIYSFQGADLETFDRTLDDLRARHLGADAPFATMDLRHSFRSSAAILNVVDLTFDERVNRGLGGETKHLAFHADRAGRVDLWPLIPKAAELDGKDWDDPVDLLPAAHHSVILAEGIAAEVRRMIDAGVQIPGKDGDPRPLHEGDILILVRRRSALFHQVIRACKARGLRVAGADRLMLSAELAVRDLTALLAFLATPEDDLSLAAVLRSPLFGWSEDALYRLAQPRGKREYLWQTLRAAGSGHAATLAILNDLRDHTDFLRPYELIERMLTRHDGRRRLIARLGREAEDGIDAFLAEALNFERAGVPSLTGFLVWMQTGEVEVKRRLDSASNAIRVMTVHGAKGLEAPVVVLPDTGDRPWKDRGAILTPGGGAAVWKTKKDESPAGLAAEQAGRKRKDEEEAMRLLYVAMTRAESWLIVAAAGEAGDGAKSWYGLVKDAMGKAGSAAHVPEALGWDYGPGLRHQFGAWPADLRSRTAAHTGTDGATPDWLNEPPPKAEAPLAPMAPTALGGAKALPGEAGLDEAGLDEAAAKRRGAMLHLLLEHLPAVDGPDRRGVGGHILAAYGLDSAETEPLLVEALGVLEAPHLSHLFAPGTLAEVELSAQLPELGGRLMQGVIDRLIVTPQAVLAADFKSNAIVPEGAEAVPDGILRQLAAYAAMLARIYPGKDIQLAIVWTRTAKLMPIPVNIVRAAMQSATLP